MVHGRYLAERQRSHRENGDIFLVLPFTAHRHVADLYERRGLRNPVLLSKATLKISRRLLVAGESLLHGHASATFGSELELVFPRQSESLAIDRQVQKGEGKEATNTYHRKVRTATVLARYLSRRFAAPPAF